jgi:hypothetical protein
VAATTSSAKPTKPSVAGSGTAVPVMTWPRISPPGNATVWMFRYQLLAKNCDICVPTIVAEPMLGHDVP